MNLKQPTVADRWPDTLLEPCIQKTLIMIIIIMITFKDTITDFLLSPHCATNCL